jgi:serine/threonine-protein kinase RsbW
MPVSRACILLDEDREGGERTPEKRKVGGSTPPLTTPCEQAKRLHDDHHPGALTTTLTTTTVNERSPASCPPSTRTYPGTRDQMRAIRADLRALLTGCPHADDIILCASELAANAAIHSNSASPGGTITVHVEIRHGQHVRIEVSDDGGLWTPPAADVDRPHGLDIVGTLATKWGITNAATGRNIWAQFDWPVQ